ncbi:MAG: hypothetical protein IJO42_00635 [Clostridia bacterium]|nr:hypothetical protein [Clostridia bacterium]
MNSEMKCMPVPEMKCEYKPTPLVESLAASDKVLEESLALVGLIRAALVPSDSLECPHRPIGNMRDMMEVHYEKANVLRDTLVFIASELGCR